MRLEQGWNRAESEQAEKGQERDGIKVRSGSKG